MRARLRMKNLLRDTWDGLPPKGLVPKGHRRIWDNKTKGWGINEMHSSTEYSWLEWDNVTNEGASLRIYTDGASNELGSGYAFVTYEGKVQTPQYVENGPLGETCPYQAQLYAIKAALMWLKSNPKKLIGWGRVNILTDSMSVVLALKATTIKMALVEDTLKNLAE